MAERGPDSESGSSSGASQLEFFEAMAWPVPRCFAGAIVGMRFEQGDVLYRDRSAYEAIGAKIPKGLSAIQVLLPQRSTRGSGVDGSGDRRLASWRSEVTVELIDLASGQAEARVLSQGKLAMALFSGDDAWLDPKREEPPLPRSARDLQQRLEECVPAFDARTKVTSGCRFLFVVDLASDASRIKALGVEEALLATGRVGAFDLSPAEAGLTDASEFHPSLVIRALVLAERSVEDVLPVLRGCLYGGGGAGGAGEGQEGEEGKNAPDRFSITRHGILQGLD